MNADVFDVLNADKHFLNDNAMILLDAATLNSWTIDADIFRPMVS